jgi:spermidine/putrescine ABC transporter ATP-binding subunit
MAGPRAGPGARQNSEASQADRSVEVHEVSKAFGSVVAVKPTTFTVPAGSMVTLLGPSGSGKTTILKMVAGFEEPSSGRVVISGRDVTAVSPHKRNLGFVFQQYALFPHLTVADNVSYSLKMRGFSSAETRKRVSDVLALVQLGDLGARYPSQLSGGQQQRVAFARAIVFEPPVLLMDEPMAALDKRLREEVQFELRRLQKHLGITTIMVTHDQAEALVMSDTIIVLNNGAVEQSGSPKDVYRSPRTSFVANFLGESNILHGVVHKGEKGLRLVCARDVHIPIAAAESGASMAYVIRPESILVGEDANQSSVKLLGRVREAVFCGDAVRTLVDIGLPNPLTAKVLTRAGVPAPTVGEQVTVSWSETDATLMPIA